MINNTTNFSSYRKNINNHEETLNRHQDFIDNYEQVLNGLFNKIYPIGCLYWSSNPTNPSQLFGGTWTQISGKFIYAADTNHTVNTTGGEEVHILTTAEMPSHGHTAESAGSHTHTVYRAGNGGGSWDGNGLAGSPRNSYAGYPRSVQADGVHTHNCSATGGSGAHNNMPPYLVKYCWERTA